MIWDCFDFEKLYELEWIIQKHELPFQTHHYNSVSLSWDVLGMLQPSDKQLSFTRSSSFQHHLSLQLDSMPNEMGNGIKFIKGVICLWSLVENHRKWLVETSPVSFPAFQMHRSMSPSRKLGKIPTHPFWRWEKKPRRSWVPDSPCRGLGLIRFLRPRDFLGGPRMGSKSEVNKNPRITQIT